MHEASKHYTVGSFAKLTGLSVRTLHYYDEIGLMKAYKDPQSGHRYYGEDDIGILQKIVTMKFLGYSLEDIQTLLQHPRFDASLLDSFLAQKEALEAQRKRIDTAIKAITRATVLLEDKKEVDSSIMISIIQSIQSEHEQREWLEQFLEPDMVSGLFDRPLEAQELLDKQYVDTVNEVRRLFGRPIDDPEVQTLMQEQLNTSLNYVGSDNVQDLAVLSEMNEDQLKKLEAMMPSPFTPEEEEWLQQAMDYFMRKNGMV
ncbi:MerR family transcriptional regulator [Paenibacillus sp. 1011MAR3C5]|uniref:MerR family transcriptional regulator n=1 Tax=Paenibacillus sp. 1011MAR3C5 TaxID=1675787 RepID=UPI001604212A|nr:MerR family transcriptional regulator [Paenibacillus sp. 1011MAR3C5]